MAKKSKHIFSTTDFYGNLVHCPEQTWLDHIIDEHPEMLGYEQLVQSVIKNPVEIKLSSKFSTSAAYVSVPNVGPRPQGIRVLVDYADSLFEKGSSAGFVTTAYPIDIVRFGNPQLGRTIYKKGGQG